MRQKPTQSLTSRKNSLAAGPKGSRKRLRLMRRHIQESSMYCLRQTLWLLLVIPPLTYAQGICIPEDVTVKQVRGQVFFGYEGERRPQEGVTVEVLNYKRNRIAATISDSEGRFSFEN